MSEPVIRTAKEASELTAVSEGTFNMMLDELMTDIEFAAQKGSYSVEVQKDFNPTIKDRIVAKLKELDYHVDTTPYDFKLLIIYWGDNLPF